MTHFQSTYWETTGATKTFTHPLNPAWLAGLDRDVRILDYGCGYGRVMALLREHGFRRMLGVDVSAALLARGSPGFDFELVEAPPAVRREAGSFDVAVLFAVLTCIPDDDAQRDLIAELRRLLTPGGLLYVSDLLLDPGASRYRADGTFVTGDGAVCRHHDIEHLRGLLAGFELLDERRLEVRTMNGNRAAAAQLLARRT